MKILNYTELAIKNKNYLGDEKLTSHFMELGGTSKISGVAGGEEFEIKEKEETRLEEEEIFDMPWLGGENEIQQNPPKFKLPSGIKLNPKPYDPLVDDGKEDLYVEDDDVPKFKVTSDITMGYVVSNNPIKKFLVKGDEYIDESLGFVGKKYGEFKEKYPKTGLMLQGIGVLNSKISDGFEDPIIKPIEKKFGALNREYVINPSLEYLDIYPGEKGYRFGSGLIGGLEGVIAGKTLLGVNNLVALDLAGSGKGYHFARVNKVPYEPRRMEQILQQNNPSSTITSSTLPKVNQKNVSLAGTRHPITEIVFDKRGFPIFDQHVIFDTRISSEIYSIKNERLHKKAATRDLREKITQGLVAKNQFNKIQLEKIMKGESKIPNFTWHHHQDTGRMQLIPRDLHNQTGHIGGMHLWYQK